MKKILNFLTLLLSVCAGLSVCAAADLRLITTTSTENSGLTDYLITEFTNDTGINVHLVAVGTGKALAIARNGDADVILVHSKPDEQAFVEQGYGVERVSIMYNDFILVGPKVFKDIDSMTGVLKSIEAGEQLFVSRGDDSGTHKKELQLWQTSGVTTQGNWYRESGQGMGKTLQIASELDAYTLTDRGTWLAQNSNQPLRLQIVFEGDEQLYNPYSVIAVSPIKFPHVNVEATNQLIGLVSFRKRSALNCRL